MRRLLTTLVLGMALSTGAWGQACTRWIWNNATRSQDCASTAADGVGVSGPASATAGNVATLDATGKVLADGGVAPAVLTRKFFGTATPGSVTGNLPGDLFSDTTNHRVYQCNAPSGTAAPACTAVAAAGWTWLNGMSCDPATGTCTIGTTVLGGGTGTGATQVGLNASAGALEATALGYGAIANARAAIAIGHGATNGTNAYSVAIGEVATAGGASSVALGNAASALAGSAVCIGLSCSVAAAQTGGVAIGQSSVVSDVSVSGLANQVAVGEFAQATEGRATAFGANARATGISSTALGRGARAANTHAVALGRGAYGWIQNSVNLGFSGATTGNQDVYFFNGSLHKWVDPVDSATITLVPSSTPIVLHGMDAYDETASVNDVAGGDLIMAAGVGTGTGTGGSVRIQVAAASASHNNTKNTLADAAVFGPNKAVTFYGPITQSGAGQQTLSVIATNNANAVVSMTGNGYQWSHTLVGATGFFDLRDVYLAKDRLGIDSSGTVVTGGVNGADTGAWGQFSTGKITLRALTKPTITSVTPQGTPAGQTWSYVVEACLADGVTCTEISDVVSTTTGAATLNTTDKNRLLWGAVTGAVSYRVRRTASGGTPNTVGRFACTAVTAVSCDDVGAVGDTVAGSATNTTGVITGKFNSADGTVGATVTTCTGFKNGLCVSGT